MRTLKIEEDKMKPVMDIILQIQTELDIIVEGVKRSGNNYEFIFDRDLAKEEAVTLARIKEIIQTKFPKHNLTEVVEAKES